MSDPQTPFDLVEPEQEPQNPVPPTAPSIAARSAPLKGVPLESAPQDNREQARGLNEDFADENSRAGGWTIPLLCIGIALIACCLIIPATEDNRRLVWEREHLKADLDQISHQIDVNNEFLKRIADDPSLSERLAQRQMKMVREGSSVLALRGESIGRDMSPYELTTLAPPAPMPPYQPRGGALAALVANPHTQLYVMGTGMLLVAAGLVLGYTPLHASSDRD